LDQGLGARIDCPEMTLVLRRPEDPVLEARGGLVGIVGREVDPVAKVRAGVVERHAGAAVALAQEDVARSGDAVAGSELVGIVAIAAKQPVSAMVAHQDVGAPQSVELVRLIATDQSILAYGGCDVLDRGQDLGGAGRIRVCRCLGADIDAHHVYAVDDGVDAGAAIDDVDLLLRVEISRSDEAQSSSVSSTGISTSMTSSTSS